MLLIRNIGELILPARHRQAQRGHLSSPTGTPDLRVQRMNNAALWIDGLKIAGIGSDADAAPRPGCTVIDAAGGCVVPGLVDCHTHAVFAGSRVADFVARIEGKSYLQIAETGGGIRTTVEAVRAASEDELVHLALPRLRRMLECGTTTAEIKSGYGLTVEDELKMLRVIRRLNELQPVELVGTYLAAHTVPREFEGRPDDYLDLVLADSVLQRIRDERLAEFCDVFCERSAFDLAHSRRVLEAGKRFGLRPRLHADQITQMGASRLAAEVGAVSADHLEKIDDDALAAMRQAGTIAVLLPACSFFLGVEQAPARRIIGAGVPVALASDFNPGSSHIESMPLVVSIACTQLRMTPAEALVAATHNAAAVLGRAASVGSIAPGMQADLLVLEVGSIDEWLYSVGRNCVRTVIKRGRVVPNPP